MLKNSCMCVLTESCSQSVIDKKIGDPLVRTLLETFSHGDDATVVPFNSEEWEDDANVDDLSLVTVTKEWRSHVMSRLIDREAPSLRTSFGFALSQLQNTSFESRDKVCLTSDFVTFMYRLHTL